MKLPKELSDAYAAINGHIDEALIEHNKMEAERVRLMKLSKEDVIAEFLKLKYSAARGKRCINVEALVYGILEDPACAFLTYDMIEAAIKAREIPGVQTSVGNLRWYASKGLEKDRDVKPRASREAIHRLIAQIAVNN